MNKMNENSVIVPIEKEDLLGAENSEDVDESGEKVLSEIEEFAHSWRSSVRVANAILQFSQYEYLSELLFKQNMTNLADDDWRKYVYDCKKLYFFNNYLLNKLKRIQTNNVLEEEQKKKDIKYLSDLRDLLRDIWFEKRNILTPLLPVLELNFQETATLIKKKGESKYKRIFHNLLHFYIFVYKEELSSDTLLKKLKILFKNISSRRQQFDEFIRNFVINQECSEEVLERWEELQQFLTSYFNDNPKETQQNKPKYTKVAEQSSQFFLFLQSLLKKDTLKWPKEIDQLLKDHQYEIHSFKYQYYILGYSRNIIENNVKQQTFFILLLDIKFDLRNFVRAYEAIIQKTLNDNFLKQWRRILHVPITLLHFQQYQLDCCNLRKDQSEEWAAKKKKEIDTFKDIIGIIINCVKNILKKLKILKNTLIILKSDQLNEDSEYLHNLLQILTEIYNDERNILFPLPPVPNLNVIIAAYSPTSESESALSDVVFHLYYFYKLINKIPKTDFCEWNKEMFINVSKNFNNLDNFICYYCKNQHYEKDVLSTWEEFKIFLSKNKNIENNLLKTGGEEPNRFIELYRLIFKKNRQCERELQSVSLNDFNGTIKYDKMHEMQIYIILVLDATFDVRIFIRNTTNLDSSLAIIFQFLLIYFKYNKIHRIILHSSFNVNPIFYIVELMQKLITISEKKDFSFYNHLNQFRNILEDEDELNSMKILKEIENMNQFISNLNNDESNSKKQNIILYNLYCLWWIFIKKKTDLEENFFQWNKEMFYLIFLKLNDVDLIINKLFTEDDKTTEMWRCFKKFLIRKYAEKEENDLNEIHHNVNFQLFLDDNSSFHKKIETILNFINIDSLEISVEELEALYILILLDSPLSLKQMANFLCEHNMLITYNDLNFYKYVHFTLLNDFIKNKIYKLKFFDFYRFENLINNLNKYTFACKTLNKDHLNIIVCLNQIKENKIENIFYLDKVVELPTNRFQLEMPNNYHQLLYLYFYFKITQINELQGKHFAEKIQTMLKYIHTNCEKMDKFINSYFENLEDTNVFKSNWNLIKKKINEVSLDEFNNSWQLFNSYEKCSYEEYFKKELINIPEKIVVLNEKYIIAQHILLILLKVPLNEILDSQYKKKLTLEDLFSYMYRCKELLPILKKENKNYISHQYDLTKHKFLKKLENVSNTTEAQDESSQLLLKSKFHELDYENQTEIIDELMDIVHSKNTFYGYLKMILKIFLPVLPLIDIILDTNLTFTFFFSNQINYCIWTIMILLITGIATAITERNLKSRIEWQPTLFIPILNHRKWRSFLSFIQMIAPLQGLNDAILHWKIYRGEFKHKMPAHCIRYVHPDNQRRIKTLKYVEMCLENIPQIILQLYIIMFTNEASVLQLLSICTSTLVISSCVWPYILSRGRKYRKYNTEYLTTTLRIICFYGLRIMSICFILLSFPWWLTIISFGVRLLINYYLFARKIENNKKKEYLSLLKGIHSDLVEEGICNFITIIEFLTLYSWFLFYTTHFNDSLNYSNNLIVAVIIFAVYPICLCVWYAIVAIENDLNII